MNDQCTWHQAGDTSAWDTECGHTFEFFDGGPEDNGAKYCQYCGGSIREVREEKGDE